MNRWTCCIPWLVLLTAVMPPGGVRCERADAAACGPKACAPTACCGEETPPARERLVRAERRSCGLGEACCCLRPVGLPIAPAPARSTVSPPIDAAPAHGPAIREQFGMSSVRSAWPGAEPGCARAPVRSRLCVWVL